MHHMAINRNELVFSFIKKVKIFLDLNYPHQNVRYLFLGNRGLTEKKGKSKVMSILLLKI